MYGPEVRETILNRLATGDSLNRTLRDEGMPDYSTVMRWVDADAEFREKYARAKEAGAEADFDRMHDIQTEEPKIGPSGSVDSGWVAWKRLQIDALKWELSKKAPKKYGEKIDLNHAGKVEFGRIECVIVDPKG